METTKKMKSYKQVEQMEKQMKVLEDQLDKFQKVKTDMLNLQKPLHKACDIKIVRERTGNKKLKFFKGVVNINTRRNYQSYNTV